MHIAFEQLTIGALFTKQHQYRVPLYQRPYRWEKLNVEDLWSDLVDVPKSGHFLGPMVLCPEKGGEKAVEVIDGQQRLTTIQLLLALVRDKYLELGDMSLEDDAKASENTYTLLRQQGHSPFWRLQPGPANRPVFEDYILRRPSDAQRRSIHDLSGLTKAEKSHNKALIDAARYLEEKLASHIAGHDQLRKLAAFEEALLDRVSIGALTVQDLEDAYVLFETLNDRGLRLSAADLLKSHLLSQFAQLKNSSPTALSDAADRWDDLVEGLGGGDISSFLRHLLLVEHKKVRKPEIFPNFKKKVASAGPIVTLEELSEAGAWYAELMKPGLESPLGNALDDLNQTSVDTHRIVLLAARKHLQDAAILKLTRPLESLSFRWAVTGRNAQELETHYHTAAKKLADSRGTMVDEVEGQLWRLVPPDEEFGAAFAAETLGTQGLAAYALRKIESALSPHGEVQLKSASSVHLEHVMPKTPKDHWRELVPDDALYEATVQRWGNLTLLDGRKNEAIGNGPWLTKVKAYGGSKVSLTADLASLIKWEPEEIDLRARWLASIAVRVWPAKPGKVDLSGLEDSFSSYLLASRAREIAIEG